MFEQAQADKLQLSTEKASLEKRLATISGSLEAAKKQQLQAASERKQSESDANAKLAAVESQVQHEQQESNRLRALVSQLEDQLAEGARRERKASNAKFESLSITQYLSTNRGFHQPPAEYKRDCRPCRPASAKRSCQERAQRATSSEREAS